MKNIYYVLGLTALLAASCAKTQTDDEKIKAYIAEKGLQMQVTPDGLYYRIDSAGAGGSPTVANQVTVRYKGYLLDGTVFDASKAAGVTFSLSKVIQGWQLGIPKFQRNGGGKLIIPSALGYGAYGQGTIPGNAPLVFDVTLLDYY
jgi:FKBP-type peptidyl-prolyl cis-trans isomerase FkpA